MKTRENPAFLDFLAVDNFDFTRKIVKKTFGEKCVKMLGFCQNWISVQKFDFSNSVDKEPTQDIKQGKIGWSVQIIIDSDIGVKQVHRVTIGQKWQWDTGKSHHVGIEGHQLSGCQPNPQQREPEEIGASGETDKMIECNGGEYTPVFFPKRFFI